MAAKKTRAEQEAQDREDQMTENQVNETAYDAARPDDVPPETREDQATREMDAQQARQPFAPRDAPRQTPPVGTSPEMEKRFTRHGLADARSDAHVDLRDAFKDLAARIEAASPSGREQSLALTKLEEALFWANAAAARSD